MPHELFRFEPSPSYCMLFIQSIGDGLDSESFVSWRFIPLYPVPNLVLRSVIGFPCVLDFMEIVSPVDYYWVTVIIAGNAIGLRLFRSISP